MQIKRHIPQKLQLRMGLTKSAWNPWIPGPCCSMLVCASGSKLINNDKHSTWMPAMLLHLRTTGNVYIWLYIWARNVKSNPSNLSCRTETKHAFGGSCGSSKPASHFGFNNHSWGSTRSLEALPTRHHLTSEYCQTFISLIYQQDPTSKTTSSAHCKSNDHDGDNSCSYGDDDDDDDDHHHRHHHHHHHHRCRRCCH